MEKRISNKEVIDQLKEVLAAMEVKNYNRFRIRAYQNAIDSIEALTMNVYDMWEKGRIDDIVGIGESLHQHFNDLFENGEVKEWNNIKRNLPEGMFSLIGIRGIGAKRAYRLAQAFKLNNRETAVAAVAKAAKEGKINSLEGFGEKMEDLILDAISEIKKTKNEKQRLLLYSAEQVATRIVDYMNKCEEVQRIDVLGSLRRRVPTIGDLDIAVATDDPDIVLDHFLQFEEIDEVLAKGDKKASVNLITNAQVDIRVIHPQTYGSMLQYFTGSKQHNVLLRTFALEKGMSLSEYGIKIKDNLLEFADEESFYGKLGLDYIEPELREGRDEIELAQMHTLPKLIETKDIKGDLHVHTTASDGLNTINEMMEMGINMGYQYLGISDHSPSVTSRGLEEVSRVIAQKRTDIDHLNASQDKLRLLFGYEVNILADATLSLPMEMMKKLDFVVAGIHTAYDQPREQITERLISAMRNPLVTIIAHSTGRLLNERDGYEVDWAAFFDAAEKYDKILEINSQPSRLDLVEDLVIEAKNRGIKLIVNSDAHDTSSMLFSRYGIDVARRAGCERKHIVNTLPLNEFLRILNY